MKRIIIFVLVISLLVVPVAAEGWYNDFSQSSLNVLDYNYNNPDNTYEFNSSGSITFDIPDFMNFSYVDILLYCIDSPVYSISVNGTVLNLLDLGNGVIRAYGYLPSGVQNHFTVNLLSNGSTWLSFLRFNVNANYTTPVGLLGNLHWERGTSPIERGDNDQTSFRDTVFYVGPPVTNVIYDGNVVPWKVMLTADEWYKYDYLTFFLGSDLSIDSISVTDDFGVVPFTTNIVSTGNDNSFRSFKYVTVTIDIRNYPRNQGSVPTIIVNGSQEAAYPGSFYLYEVTGSIDYNYDNPVLYYLKKLFKYSNDWWSALFTTYLPNINTSITNGFSHLGSWFENLYNLTLNSFNSLSTVVSNGFSHMGSWFENLYNVLNSSSQSNIDAANRFDETVTDQSQQFDEMNDVMNSVDRPDPEDVDIDFSQYVSQSDITGITSPLQALFSGDIFGVVLILSVMMGTVSFVFYGKR